MSLHFIYEELKYWLPVVTLMTLVVKAFFSSKRAVGEYADKLLNNHLAHIEAYSERAALASESGAKSAENLAKQIGEMARDQRDILTGIEVLKDR